MTEYTRQMHEKIMKIYRRETIRQYLWASIGFFPPVGALLLMIPLKDKVLSLFSNGSGNFAILAAIFTAISTFAVSGTAAMTLFGISGVRVEREIEKILYGTEKRNGSMPVPGSFSSPYRIIGMIADTKDDIRKNVAYDMQDKVLYMSMKKYFEEDVPAKEKELNEKRIKRIEKLKKRKQLLIERGNKNETSLHEGEAREIPEDTGKDQDK
jgi:hypothetical protein